MIRKIHAQAKNKIKKQRSPKKEWGGGLSQPCLPPPPPPGGGPLADPRRNRGYATVLLILFVTPNPGLTYVNTPDRFIRVLPLKVTLGNFRKPSKVTLGMFRKPPKVTLGTFRKKSTKKPQPAGCVWESGREKTHSELQFITFGIYMYLYSGHSLKICGAQIPKKLFASSSDPQGTKKNPLPK
jgi:hypothetical protein